MTSLMPGERALWEGRPPTGIIFRPIDFFLIPFSLFWAGFVIFWNIAAWTSEAPADFKFFGIPFVIAGLYITVGRFAVDSWQRGRLTYLVTNKRVIIRKGEGRSVRSIDIRRLPVLELNERSDGSGTINFDVASNSWFANNGFSMWMPSGSALQFIRIPNARNVYDLIGKQADQPL